MMLQFQPATYSEESWNGTRQEEGCQEEDSREEKSYEENGQEKD